MEQRYRYAAAVAVLVVLALTFSVSVPGDTWRKQVLVEDGVDRFVDAVSSDSGSLDVFYRDIGENGVQRVSRFHTPIGFVNDVYNALLGPSWSNEVVDAEDDTGMFLDAAVIGR